MRLREPTRTEEHTLWGTYYPDPYGMVTLSIGAVFERLSEMKEHFGKSGRYVIEWESGERETNA